MCGYCLSGRHSRLRRSSIETHLLQSRLTQQPHNVDSETASVLTLSHGLDVAVLAISGSFAPLMRAAQRRAVLSLRCGQGSFGRRHKGSGT